MLVDAQVRDLFCEMADAGLIELFWSDEILEETRRVLINRLAKAPSAVDRLLNSFRSAFPGGALGAETGFIAELEIPDPNDRHVIASAVLGECDVLVTFNTKDFPPGVLSRWDLEVMDVDRALGFLACRFPNKIADVVTACRTKLMKPVRSQEDYLARLAERAPVATISIGTIMHAEPYVTMAMQAAGAHGDKSPQSAVRSLISALESRSATEVAGLLDPGLASVVTGKESPHPFEILLALRDKLDDVFAAGGWGFATAPRVTSSDTEVVKLVQGWPTGGIVWGPMVVPGHTFLLKIIDQSWVIVQIDGDDPSVLTDLPG